MFLSVLNSRNILGRHVQDVKYAFLKSSDNKAVAVTWFIWHDLEVDPPSSTLKTLSAEKDKNMYSGVEWSGGRVEKLMKTTKSSQLNARL